MTTASRSPLRIALWTLAGLAVVVVSTLAIAAWALPGWITGRGAALATEALGRPVRIEQARFQPWRLGLVIEGVSIAGAAPGQPPLLKLAQLDAALSLRSLLRGHAVVESLSLSQPELRVARLADGHYDIDDLIQRFTPKPGDKAKPDAAEPEFAVYNIALTDGLVAFDDRPVQRKHELAGLHLALPFVSTRPADVKVKVVPRLSGKLDGVAFDSQAEALPFEDDASARLSFKLAGLDLAPLAAYVPATAPVRLSTGKLDVDLALDFAERPQQPANIRLSGGVQLRDLALNQPDGQPLLAFKRLSLPLADVQPLRRQLGFGQIVLDAPSVWLRPLPGSKSEAPAGAPAQPWQISAAGVALNDGRLTANDLVLDAIQLKLGAAAWPLAKPMQLDASARLDAATLTAEARLSREALEADAELSGLAVERLAAWLPLPGGATLVAGLSGKAQLRVAQPLDDGAADRARLALADLRVADAKLTLPGKNRPLLTLAGAQLDEASIDPAARSLTLGTLKLDAPRTHISRDAQGQLNLAPLLPPDNAASAPTGPAWAVQLASLVIDRGTLRWRDAAVAPGASPVAVVADQLRVQLGPLAWPAKAAVPAALSAQLARLAVNDSTVAASAGSLQWSGRVNLAPLSATGTLQTKALPLHLFNAYLDPAWGVQLQRAELGLKADVTAAQQAGGAWTATANGDVRVGPLAVLQTRMVDGQRVVGEDLLSWQLLQLDGARLDLAPGGPPRLAVREARLDDAYARLIVSEQGRFNLRDLGPAGAASAAAPAPGPAASAPPLQLAVEHIRVNRGLVDFNDRFVRPSYSARLSELQGSLGAFSTTDTALAPLTLRGKVAGTGLLEIDGQLKPGGPVAMDVQANATDIELAPLSPYAGKYAGFAIERGKLSTKLRYKIEPGGLLTASNQIILNQLTFGDRVDSPEATTLPVRFAVALLKDRDGVIDVNLPVSGSLSDPEFSVGGLVWKLLVNLIGKALTSPFALFSGNDSPEEAQVAFTTGSAELTDIDKLDRTAKLLTDKPGVQLTLTGWANPAAESTVLREQRLANAMNAENAATPAEALKRLYQATKLPSKPKNFIGLAKDLPPEQMRALLMASYTVDDEAVRQLAVARAVAVRDALLARGAPNARVFLAAPKLCDGDCGDDASPHVDLTLAAH